MMTSSEKNRINKRLTATLIKYYNLDDMSEYHTTMYKHFINLSISHDVGGLVISEDTFKGIVHKLLKRY